MTIRRKIEDALALHVEAVGAHLSGWTPEIGDQLAAARVLGMTAEEVARTGRTAATVGLGPDDMDAIAQDIARGAYTPPTWRT